MRKQTLVTLISSCAFLCALNAGTLDGRPNASSPSVKKAHTQYNSLDPRSIPQQLAFYELYPNTPEGQRALQQAWKLLSGQDLSADSKIYGLTFSPSTVEAIVNLVNKQPNVETPILSDNELAVIDRLAKRLPNRNLKGHYASNEEEVLALPPEEIDLARGLFLSQIDEENSLQKLRSYEALIDLMALQILTQVPMHAPPEQKIRAINKLIFDEMGFRFPPHSLYAKDIDKYTFLPSILDSRHGVCLGVSILYLSLAQRLDLPLEAITPPGHIYIRYREGNKMINIETTARGVHVDSEEYLGIDTCALQEQNIKEVIGNAHINQAAIFWKGKDYAKALECYKIAEKYIPEDMLLKEMMGFNYLFVGEVEKGEELLKSAEGHISSYTVSKNTLAEDYLLGAVDIEGIKTIFLEVDESRDSILEKKEILKETLEKNPEFREGWLSLAITWLQLHREKEALKTLTKYHDLRSDDPTAEYYLAMIYADRFHYKKAWEHFRNVEKIVNEKQHHPKALKSLYRQLTMLYPEQE